MHEWAIDLSASTATHESGLAVAFAPTDEAGVFDGKVVGDIPAALMHDPQTLMRMMREAGDAYIAARAGRH